MYHECNGSYFRCLLCALVGLQVLWLKDLMIRAQWLSGKSTIIILEYGHTVCIENIENRLLFWCFENTHSMGCFLVLQDGWQRWGEVHQILTGEQNLSSAAHFKVSCKCDLYLALYLHVAQWFSLKRFFSFR